MKYILIILLFATFVAHAQKDTTGYMIVEKVGALSQVVKTTSLDTVIMFSYNWGVDAVKVLDQSNHFEITDDTGSLYVERKRLIYGKRIRTRRIKNGAF